MAGAEVATKQEEQNAVAESEEAYAVETQVKAAMADGREALWRLAEALHAFDEMRGWLKLGHDNLSQWLADSDVTLTRATYYRLVRTWRKLVVERHIDADRVRGLDQSKVAIVVDQITEGKATVDDAFADVEALGASDLREKYYGPKPEKPKPADPDPANTDNSDSGRQPLTAEEAAEMTDDDLNGIVEGDWPDEDRDVALAEIAQRAEVDGAGDAREPVSSPDDPDADDELGEGEPAPSAEPEATSPSAQALVDADELPWGELKVAYESGAAFPRTSREVIGAFLQWHKTHLG
jgi:hypothetical protein